MRRAFETALIVLFAILIAAPTIASVTGWMPCVAAPETHALNGSPPLVLRAIKTFPEAFDDFYNDHYGLRGALIRAHGFFRHRLLRVSSMKVLIGKAGWLYTTEQGAIDDYLGQAPFTSGQLSYLRNTLEGKQAWLAQRGIRYLFVIVPDKQTVYPEHLPDSIRPYGGVTRRMQLVNELSRSYVSYLDLTDTLMKAKECCAVYYVSDSHWTPIGKLIGCSRICERLARWFPWVRPMGLDEFTVRRRQELCDLGHELGLPRWSDIGCDDITLAAGNLPAVSNLTLPPGFMVPGQYVRRSRLATLDPAGRGRLLVFSDSFLDTGFDQTSLLPLMRPFKRSVFVIMPADSRVFGPLVEQEHPDVVIEELAERMIALGPSSPEWAAARKEFAASAASRDHKPLLTGER
jgi:alginate O-acetyltransferase complex protein AlgJ